MPERACIRGCTQQGVHFATCEDYALTQAADRRADALGVEPGSLLAGQLDAAHRPTCGGCAPEPARDGVMVCDRCYRRMRRHLDNAPDLVGRLRSLADPASAMVYEDRSQASGGGAAHSPAPVPADLIDAAEDVMRTLRTWAVYVDPRSGVIGGMPAGAGSLGAYEYARDCANVILSDFDRLANRTEVVQLGEAVLERHAPNEHGERVFWSIADAVSRYRLERPDAAIVVDDRSDEDGELATSSVPEWRDRLITRAEAEREAYARSGATLRRWVKEELIEARAVTQGPMGRVTWFRESEVLAVRERMDARVGRPKAVRS